MADLSGYASARYATDLAATAEPCPFCGCERIAFTLDGDGYHVGLRCEACRATGPVPRGAACDAAMIQAWNRRA